MPFSDEDPAGAPAGLENDQNTEDASRHATVLTDERPEFHAFRLFARLAREERQLKRQLAAVVARKDALEPQLRDYLGAEGFERVRLEGFTIYLRREIWARAKPGFGQAEICRALKNCGLGHFVREMYQTQPLSKHVRELAEAHRAELVEGTVSFSDLLPEAAADVLNTEPSYRVVALETE